MLIDNMPPPQIPSPAMRAFPTTLSAVYVSSLEEYLTERTIRRLKELEDELRESIALKAILQEQNEDVLLKTLTNAWLKALDYYVEAATLIWRAMDHDYDKLLRISEASYEFLESLFFSNINKLKANTLINAVAGLRVLRKVSERVIFTEMDAEPSRRTIPIDYLAYLAFASFLTWYLVAYLNGEVRTARSANLKALADGVLNIAQRAYKEAVKNDLYGKLSDTERAYWGPAWQTGVVEAELDKRLKRVKSFNSVQELLQDLRGQ